MTQPLRWFTVLVLLFAIAPALRAQTISSTQMLGVGSLAGKLPGYPQSRAPFLNGHGARVHAQSPKDYPGAGVAVDSIPPKPNVSTNAISWCQFQQASPLSASATDGASLVWYGTNATGSVGSTTATQPATTDAGTFTYYVAQKLNDSESERAEITVEVRAASPAPTVSAVRYCRGAQAVQLSAVAAPDGSLSWYTASTGGTGSTGGPTPSTNNAGVQTYYVAQTVGTTCESKRVPLTVTVTELPNAPSLSQETYRLCQNAKAEALSAFGQNLQWYDVAAGGVGMSSVTPGTETVGTTLYYVSQTVNGCEGARNRVTVRVSETPVAPTVSRTTYEFCQGANAVISGIIVPGLATSWNIYGDEPGLTNIYPIENVAYATVSTAQARTLVYSLFQITATGCKSLPSQLITVTVKPTPAAPTGQSVGVCPNETAPVLQATGQQLRWYTTSTGGTGSATAPIISTSPVSPATYYVSQTPDGCESPRAAISVFVQSPPTGSISGTATTNLGRAVPLKLTFTGVGPYRYKLSDGSVGTSLEDTTIRVLPTRTTTYQVVEVANKCGVGLPNSGATAVVTVTVPAIQTLAFSTTTLCAGASLVTRFTTSGAFNAGSVFKLQYAKIETDSTNIHFVDVGGSQSVDGQIAGVLPANTPAGTYWVRVMATNPSIPILGTTSPTRLTVRPLATGALTGAQTISAGQSANLSVAFTGEGPWSFSYRDSTAAGGLGAEQRVQTTANPYVFEVKPGITTAYFLTAVGNSCGLITRTGSLLVVNVSPLLGTEDQALADAVAVFPVPTTTTLTVRINGLTAQQPALLELTDRSGRTVLRHEIRRETSVLALDQYPAGTYVLRINVGDRTASKRIVKL